MGRAHSVLYPNSAPTWEYVAIPPASLPAIAVIIPGPIAAKITMSFDFFGSLPFSSPCAGSSPVEVASSMSSSSFITMI